MAARTLLLEGLELATEVTFDRVCARFGTEHSIAITRTQDVLEASRACLPSGSG